MEKISANFPQYGKNFRGFSTLWKKFLRFFHSMENRRREGLKTVPALQMSML